MSLAAPVRSADDAGSGLPLPRFASLRAKEANLRAGPGTDYPIEWVFRRPGLPVEVVAEYGHWRKIRDWQGDGGWIHKSMLSGRRNGVIVGDETAMRSGAAPQDRPLAQVQPGAIARILECPTEASPCRVSAAGYEGWLDREALWGVYVGEVIR